MEAKMTSPADLPSFGDFAASNPLRSQEGFDEDELGEDVLDQGYSPAEAPLGVNEWGLTAREGASHEDLTHRLRREVPEVSSSEEGDGLGDTVDTDGELIDDQVGDARAGRLLSWDTDVNVTGYDGDDYWARDVGIDGGAASAEEAAIHIVPDTGDDL
ncbi:DUF5709 domain-containing protein [Streptomyces sp. NPDC096538]|jgi:hypothetical protein|uniref:DUF5709 domain-containing protein n=1 Tax=Streptomyces sp. NPDC096538 TaxID=3155427 RepID=UPI0033313ACB